MENRAENSKQLWMMIVGGDALAFACKTTKWMQRERERSGKKIKILWNIYTITCDMRCVPIYAPGPGARPLTNVCSVANFQQTFTFARISQTIINLDVCARECEARPSQNCVHAVAAAGAVSVHFISLGVLSPPNLRGTMASPNNISVVEHF